QRQHAAVPVALSPLLAPLLSERDRVDPLLDRQFEAFGQRLAGQADQAAAAGLISAKGSAIEQADTRSGPCRLAGGARSGWAGADHSHVPYPVPQRSGF